MSTWRIEKRVAPGFPDPDGDAWRARIALALPRISPVGRCELVQVYWIEAAQVAESAFGEIFDEVGWFWDRVAGPARPGCAWTLEKRFLPGVTDNVARTLQEALAIVLGSRATGGIRSASGLALHLFDAPGLSRAGAEAIAREVFYNPLIERCEIQEGESDPAHFVRAAILEADAGGEVGGDVESVRLAGLSDERLVTLSRERVWALDTREMRAIAARFVSDGRDPTDVEMEILAQTWSEHCKHKIFGATIRYEGPEGDPVPREIHGLYRQAVQATTRELPRTWLLSVFSDNAGIVAFDASTAVCIKVETHNSPSALDPFGGALTGIVGVNRDILGCGLGARPLANTDVFCLAPPGRQWELPERILHPRRVLEGVRLGVEHGGNQSGIPTVNGALVFDESYLGKPLVYCGTIGVLPREIAGRPCETKEIRPGDRIAMVGGRIGKDGIHGATFSSAALDDRSPASAVQLGDPITQKRMADFLLEARDRGLYRAITDNGAGGLSSSVGELARLSGGARLDVTNAPVKYLGLKPFELVVSESQERMTLAVPPGSWEELAKLARARSVEITDLGEFDASGFFEVVHGGRTVAKLALDFLHEGCPRMELSARWEPPARIESRELRPPFDVRARAILLSLLSRPGIASKEWLIRQYDHEVQGCSVIKPLNQARVGALGGSPGRSAGGHPGGPASASPCGPNDAGVLRLAPDRADALAVSCGIQPRLSRHDPWVMAQAAVDEAVRNVVCVGAEFGRAESVLALVDNFCWPDPVGDPAKTAALARAAFGMREAALELGAPFVSGKDSMKNDYRGRLAGRDHAISVVPTLLITALGRLADSSRARSADTKRAGEMVYLLGGARFGLLGSELEAMLRGGVGNEGAAAIAMGGGAGGVADLRETSILAGARLPSPDWNVARSLYGWLGTTRFASAAHDVSDGGLLVTLAEMLFARGLGAEIRVPHAAATSEGWDPWELFFGEGFHGVVVTTAETRALEDELRWRSVPYLRLGRVTEDPRLVVAGFGVGADETAFEVGTEALRAAWESWPA